MLSSAFVFMFVYSRFFVWNRSFVLFLFPWCFGAYRNCTVHQFINWIYNRAHAHIYIYLAEVSCLERIAFRGPKHHSPHKRQQQQQHNKREHFIRYCCSWLIDNTTATTRKKKLKVDIKIEYQPHTYLLIKIRQRAMTTANKCTYIYNRNSYHKKGWRQSALWLLLSSPHPSSRLAGRPFDSTVNAFSSASLSQYHALTHTHTHKHSFVRALVIINNSFSLLLSLVMSLSSPLCI